MMLSALAGAAAEARQILRRLLVGRLVFTPREDEAGRYYEFAGKGSISEVLSGVVLPKGWWPQRDSNPVPFDRSKSAVSLGEPLEPRARKHRTRSRAPVGLTVVDVQWGIALPAPVQGTTRHHGAAGRAKEAR